MVPAGPFAAAHAARGHRLRLHRSTHDLWRDRSEDLDLPRRYLRAEASSGACGGHQRVLAGIRISGFRGALFSSTLMMDRLVLLGEWLLTIVLSGLGCRGGAADQKMIPEL